MKTLAVIVARGETNNLVQVATLLMAAVGSGIAVRVFFRDEAIYRITRDGAKDAAFSAGYRGREAQVRVELERQGLADLPALLAQIKEIGDARLYACSSSLAICGVDAAALLPEIDGVRGLTAFLLEDVAQADRVLTF
ncbi:MAG: DsrE family protein [Candidatus Rokubacteria bacterium]|nr:DsrE family protein [Candidatus Rokubacteria bacterium]